MHRFRKRLFSKRGVVGFGRGKKMRAGHEMDMDTLTVFVEKKLPYSQLAKEDLIPSMMDGWMTDVIEVGKIKAQALTDKLRPAPGGCSIGHYAITAGTLGCVVKEGGEVPPPPPPPEPPPDQPPDGGDGECPFAFGAIRLLNHIAEVVGSSWRFPDPIKPASLLARAAANPGTRLILSNNHVLANSNQAVVGDAILQPGPYDGGRSVDKIATLLRFVPINFSGDPNRVDCALALPLSDELVSDSIEHIGLVKGIKLAVGIGTAVQKTGRTTDYTTGKIMATDVSVQVDYGGPVAFFEGQLMAGAMSAGGDSGSLLLDMQGNAVGLLFAGSDSVTLFNPIGDVLDALQVDFN